MKKIKGVRGLAQDSQPSDLYPYARKSDTLIQENHQKTVSFVQKIQPVVQSKELEKSWFY